MFIIQYFIVIVLSEYQEITVSTAYLMLKKQALSKKTIDPRKLKTCVGLIIKVLRLQLYLDNFAVDQSLDTDKYLLTFY